LKGDASYAAGESTYKTHPKCLADGTPLNQGPGKPSCESTGCQCPGDWRPKATCHHRHDSGDDDSGGGLEEAFDFLPEGMARGVGVVKTVMTGVFWEAL